ncbi:ESX-1 secretion-associated protein [Brevibacillus laterosporus]|uniref:ESX-1 secretion-associated protein n=1 Tax=Brevibacillus laterosporus TaxID=1465 RepID=A0A518VC18_BRELA|nr:ESX-1 secretion-associated protein [Brevibacillus laterosporus]
MSRILVHPHLLQELGNEYKRAAQEWSEIEGRLHHAMESLAWEVRQQSHLEDNWRAARVLMGQLQEHSSDIAKRLIESAERFQQVDRESAERLSLMMEHVRHQLREQETVLTVAGSPRFFPQQDIQRHLATLGSKEELPITRVQFVRENLQFLDASIHDGYGKNTIAEEQADPSVSGLVKVNEKIPPY